MIFLLKVNNTTDLQHHSTIPNTVSVTADFSPTMSSSTNELSAGSQAPVPNSVPDSIESLNIIVNQLPDPACELFNPNPYPMGFLLFPLLPFELRLLVWKFVCCLPQRIDIFGLSAWPKGYKKKVQGFRFYERFLGFMCEGQNPGVLTADRESRTISKSIYQPLLRITTMQTSVRYFNPSVDTIKFEFKCDNKRSIPAEIFAPGAAKSIQNLLLSQTCWGSGGISPTNRFLFCWNIEGHVLQDDTALKTLEEWQFSAGLRFPSLFGGLRNLTFDDLYFLEKGQRFPAPVNDMEGIKEIRDHLVEQYKALKAKDPTVFRPAVRLEHYNGNSAWELADTYQGTKGP
ncbi:hypothetical protein HYALB_00004660 [Hymenoscyphus albidus]|uniref:2EXR domain-containing protein n=1 Tax=Hymenoscyphus albidus TaxID=595503 RepID=A0A9N9LRS5_9HELO|nr:hypothetical protein HYALB_00004660 [Hymenoscyphus albidus]